MKSMLLLVAFAACNAVCVVGGYIDPYQMNVIMSELAKSELSPEQALKLLYGLDPSSEIGKYEAVNYLHLTQPRLVKCFKDAFESQKKMCKENKLAGLKKYCDHYLSEYLKYCKDHRGDVAMMLKKSMSDDLRGAGSIKYDYDAYVKKEGRENKQIQDNMYRVCKSMDQSYRWQLIRQAKAIVKSLTDKDLTYLGWSEEEMFKYVDEAEVESLHRWPVKYPGKEKGGIKRELFSELVKYARATAKYCSTIDIYFPDEFPFFDPPRKTFGKH